MKNIDSEIKQDYNRAVNLWNETYSHCKIVDLKGKNLSVEPMFDICLDIFASKCKNILDFGCGSGRDTKYFLNNGYHVTATDGSGVICKMATDYTGIQVKQMLFEELDDRNQYDGIWACASVLHLSREKLPNIFHKMHQALKTNGIIYTSFKYGTFEGERNDRYFTDFTEGMFEEFVRKISGLQIEKMWITGDVREGRGDERWLNILLRKTDVC